MSAAYQMPQPGAWYVIMQALGRPIKACEPMYSGWFFVEAQDETFWWVHESGRMLKSARHW